ncbi:hypothetical protein [Pantoea sp.]
MKKAILGMNCGNSVWTPENVTHWHGTTPDHAIPQSQLLNP